MKMATEKGLLKMTARMQNQIDVLKQPRKLPGINPQQKRWKILYNKKDGKQKQKGNKTQHNSDDLSKDPISDQEQSQKKIRGKWEGENYQRNNKNSPLPVERDPSRTQSSE